MTFARAFLNDDAAWYRYDSPDFFIGGYILEWRLPQAPCDMWVICVVDAQQRIEYHDAADDGGWGRAAVVTENTLENGEWAYIEVGTPTDTIVTFDSTGNRGFGQSYGLLSDVGNASIESDRLIVYKAFSVKTGNIPGFRLVHMIELSGQDGVVDVLATFRTHQRGVGSGPPILNYFMLPMGGGGCFINTAICEVLGKSDDCEELRALRCFRDGYFKSVPGGDALVADYYRRAPVILARLGFGAGRTTVLRRVYHQYLKPTLQYIHDGINARALENYRVMVADLERVITEKHI